VLKRKIKILLTAAAFALALSSTSRAQTKMPAETRNAALRYWMAFAQMQDVPTDKPTADLLAKTVAGDAPWNEAKFGQLLDNNSESIETMQRATKLPDCDWGLEYSRGPQTPITFVRNSALAMGRLNTLYGMRQAAKGDPVNAAETWMAGIRFSRHLAQGQSLLATLIAATALKANLHALSQTAQTAMLGNAEKNRVASFVRMLPETGFDWGQAMWYEEVPIDIMVADMEKAPDAKGHYQELMGEPWPQNFTVPSDAELASYHRLMAKVEEALRQPPDKAQDQLQALQDSLRTLHPFFQRTTPSLLKINDARKQVQTLRDQLLQALEAK
jgi:hypothetical protein